MNGAITNSLIAAGINPGADSIFATPDDAAAPGGKSRIGAITAKGVVDSLTHFESASLPKVAHIPGKVVTSQDIRFITVAD